MFEVALINMPFAEVRFPSIALTQLRAALAGSLGERISSRVHYLNNDFANFFGLESYWSIAESVESVVKGFGDWLFRKAAFPDAADPAGRYLRRHFMRPDQQRALRDHGYGEKRERLDGFLDELIDRYELERYRVVGCSSTFQQNVACIALARKLKERNPNIVTALGGAGCETPMGQVIAGNVDCIDFVFSGPALKTFPELIRCLIDGEEEKCHEIHGVFSKKKLARQAGDTADEVGEELAIDVDVPLDYDDFLDALEESFPAGAVEPILLFETSRGCWWGEHSHCTFCGMNGVRMSYRCMKPQKILAQFRRLFAYAPRVKHYVAVDSIMPRELLTGVLPHLETPPDAHIFYEVRTDLKAHELALMAEAGIRVVQPGIEALSTPSLKLMKKGTTAFQNIIFLKNCLAHGIRPEWNFLIGVPGDGEETYRKYLEDLPRMTHLPPPGTFFPVRFDRYSPYFKRAQEYGLKLKPHDSYALIYPFDKEALRDLAFFFVDTNYSAPYVTEMAKWMIRISERIDAWQNRWRENAPGLRPKLCFRGEGVYDSRSGQAVEREISAAGKRLLELLTKPMKLVRIARVLGELSEDEWAREIASLRCQDLLFQEGDLYLSLVMDRETHGE